jgi:cytochrome c oxidase cbb3-type subunit 3
MKNKLQKHLLLILPVSMPATILQAQATAAVGQTASSDFYSNLLAYGLAIIAGVVLIAALFSLVSLLNTMVKVQQAKIYQERGIEPPEEPAKAPRESLWRRLYKRLTRVVPVEKEKDILFDHEYDGIRELDNSLPPWWVYLFYITIIFAAVYMTYYHFTGAGLSQEKAYEREMDQAEKAVQNYLASQPSTVDETNVEMLKDEDQLAMGKTLFETNCAVCHGMLGEGGVGPNLTDDYWIHGGTIKDVFRTIKYGVPEKGMISWQAQLRPKDIQQVASYIMTLVGTNPPNAKEPQGVKVEMGSSGEEVEQDSTQAEAIEMN